MNKFLTAAATSHVLSVAAMEEASRLGQRSTGVDHLFLALAISEQPAGQLLRSFGITLASARDAVQAQHAEQLASLGVLAQAAAAGPISFHETGGYEWDDAALRVLKDASAGSRTGDASDVLRELVTEPSGFVAAVLERLGTAPAEVAARLEEVAWEPIATPRSASRTSLAGTTERFVPAPPGLVWNLICDPQRLPEWDPVLMGAEVTLISNSSEAATNERWVVRQEARLSNGKWVPVKPELQRQIIERGAFEEGSFVEWRLHYPDLPRANIRVVRVEAQLAAGGTQLHLSLKWMRAAESRRSLLGLLLRPLARFSIWMQLTQLGSGISRVFRSTDSPG